MVMTVRPYVVDWGKFAGDVESRCNDPSIPSRTAIRNRAKAKHRAPLCGINSEVLDLCVEHLQSLGFVCQPPQDFPDLDGGDCASVAMLLRGCTLETRSWHSTRARASGEG